MLQPVSILRTLDLIHDVGSSRIIAQVNDTHLQLFKMLGEFVLPARADEDELFLVIEGRLEIAFRGGAVSLGPGELVVVPRGTERRAVAHVETHVLLVGSAGIRQARWI